MNYKEKFVESIDEYIKAFFEEKYIPSNLKLSDEVDKVELFLEIEKLYKMTDYKHENIYLYARCIDIGLGCEIDKLKAIELYNKCINYPLAQFTLAISYFEGDGVEKNIEKALEYYKKAAENDYGMAQKALGLIYFDGIVVEKNIDMAFKYLKLAYDKDLKGVENYYFRCKRELEDLDRMKNFTPKDKDIEELENNEENWIKAGLLFSKIYVVLGCLFSLIGGVFWGCAALSFKPVLRVILSMTIILAGFFGTIFTYIFLNLIIIAANK